jgi:hypothetical protein
MAMEYDEMTTAEGTIEEICATYGVEPALVASALTGR